MPAHGVKAAGPGCTERAVRDKALVLMRASSNKPLINNI